MGLIPLNSRSTEDNDKKKTLFRWILKKKCWIKTERNQK